MSRDYLQKLWMDDWNARGRALNAALGPSNAPMPEVRPFKWDRFVLPGACSIAFKHSNAYRYQTIITLGLSQPNNPYGGPSEVEFAVKVSQDAAWAHDILYDLTTHSLETNGDMERGMFFPLTFFHDNSDILRAGVSGSLSGISKYGNLCGLFLWDDDRKIIIDINGSRFGIFVAITATEDEIELARSTTPPHLILLQKQLGLTQMCDPYRQSILQHSDFTRLWEHIRNLPHHEVVHELSRI
jgi:hypothetical protein